MMFMGACAGSNPREVQKSTASYPVQFLKNEFYKMMHPNAVTTVSMNGKGTATAIVQKTLAFLIPSPMDAATLRDLLLYSYGFSRTIVHKGIPVEGGRNRHDAP